MWPDLQKPDIIAHFSNSIYYIFVIYIPKCTYVLKFQFHIPRTFEVTALQDSSNRKIDLNSKYRENKLQVLTKTNVT